MKYLAACGCCWGALGNWPAAHC